MTETHATAPVFPPGRYGRRRATGRRRWLPAVLATLVALAGLAIAVRLYQQYGDPLYDAHVVRYTDVTDTQVVVEFQVTVPAGGSAVCVLRARDRAGAEVAREEVRVTAQPGERHPRVVHRLATTGRPVTGEVVRGRAPA